MIIIFWSQWVYCLVSCFVFNFYTWKEVSLRTLKNPIYEAKDCYSISIDVGFQNKWAKLENAREKDQLCNKTTWWKRLVPVQLNSWSAHVRRWRNETPFIDTIAIFMALTLKQAVWHVFFLLFYSFLYAPYSLGWTQTSYRARRRREIRDYNKGYEAAFDWWVYIYSSTGTAIISSWLFTVTRFKPFGRLHMQRHLPPADSPYSLEIERAHAPVRTQRPRPMALSSCSFPARGELWTWRRIFSSCTFSMVEGRFIIWGLNLCWRFRAGLKTIFRHLPRLRRNLK